MDIQINGKTISLNKQDFIASGGEGSIFAKGKIAYKIYTDPSRMIPTGKIQELSVLTDSNIIKPESIITNKCKPVGYTMRYVNDTYALCQLFTKAFKDRYNIDTDTCLNLVRGMQKTIGHIHDNGILIVDLNEMNFLSSDKFDEIYFIDVDSYQTPHYPATAIMDSIRDRHSPGKFNTGTDWFSFAIVSFQLLVGIHPYKGKHPTIKTIDERMERNISVFNKEVGVPQSCLSFKVIPQSYYDWYHAVFERGLREPPPSDLAKSLAVAVVRIISGSNNFEIEELYKCKWDIYQYTKYQQNECVIGSGVCLNRRNYIDIGSPCSIGFFGNTPIAAKINNGKLELFNIKTQQNIATQNIDVDKTMAYGGRIYLKSGENILEMQFFGSDSSPTAASRLVGKVLDKATQVFPGVMIQDLLGAYYASTFPVEGNCVQERLSFLDGFKIVDAKYENGVLMIIGTKRGKYDRFIYDMTNHQLRKIEDIPYSGLNFTVLDNGICVLIDEQERVEIFRNDDINKTKIIDDPAINGRMKLFNDGIRVLFADGNKLYSLKMKKI